MKFGTAIKSVLASAALWAISGNAMAVTCSYTNGTAPVNSTMPLQVSHITVGRDVPLGTEVYRQTFKVAAGQSPTIECRYAPFNIRRGYVVTAPLGLSRLPIGKYASSTYLTNIEGLGVVLTSEVEGGMPVPHHSSPTDSGCVSGTLCTLITERVSTFELILIKIGDVQPGLLLGGQLPRMNMYVHVNTDPMMIYSTAVSGSIQIVSRTCKTQDVVVPMGVHQTKTFTGINSASGWKEFSIALNDCPPFYGRYFKNAPSWTSQSGGGLNGAGTSGSRTNNSLQYRIDPARPAINTSAGVLSLDPAAKGSAPAATGVGVQVQNGNGSAVVLGANQDSGLTLLTNEASYTIPLRARYLQTADKVTPGPANASATFTIIYQ